MKFIPDRIERCPDHPTALVKKETDWAAWVMNDELVAEHETGHKFYCYECNRELKEKMHA